MYHISAQPFEKPGSSILLVEKAKSIGAEKWASRLKYREAGISEERILAVESAMALP